MRRSPLMLRASMALSILLASGLAPGLAEAPSAMAPASDPADSALGREIIQLYAQDQTLLADLGKAKEDQVFSKTFLFYRARLSGNRQFRNFGDPALYALWARDPAAPAIVRRAVAFRKDTDMRLRTLVAVDGWPKRRIVGDEAAASFFFLFGHADDDNVWRLSQLSTLERVFREDHVTPRLYAHLRDRLADVAGKPQIYGSIMGPDQTPGSAKLYAPLIDGVKAADKRRAAVGLPSIETNLTAFRNGADIGPYMMPMAKGMGWTLADVYSEHGSVPSASRPVGGPASNSG